MSDNCPVMSVIYCAVSRSALNIKFLFWNNLEFPPPGLSGPVSILECESNFSEENRKKIPIWILFTRNAPFIEYINF